MSRPLLLRMPIAALLIAGCSPDAYRWDADRQTQSLIADRSRRTLGYSPQVDAAPQAGAIAARAAFDRLPHTALPEIGDEPIRALDDTYRFGPSGPPADAVRAPQARDSAGVERARAFVADRYTLGPPAVLGKSRVLNLFDAVGFAVENSREYQDRMQRVYTSALDVTLERHLLSPRPFATLTGRYDGGQASSNYRNALTALAEAGVRQRLPFGGEVVASALVEFVQAINNNSVSGESATLALRASVPLLQGAGFINLEGLIASERNLVYSIRDFEQFRRDFAIRIASAYFRLVAQQQSIRNRFTRYLDAVSLTAQTEAFMMAGKLSALEVQRSQQELLQAEDDLNRALQSYDNALDDFKILLGMAVPDELTIAPIALDVPTPDLDVDRMTRSALQYRLDLQTALDRVDDARRGVQNAKNALLPGLDLDLSGTMGTDPGDPASSLTVDRLEYSGSLTLDLPIDRLPERNRYRAALLDLDSAQRDVETLEDNILADMRQAARGIRSAQTSLDLQLRGIDIARSRLEFARESLLLGRLTDSRNVVEAQNALLRAQDAFEQARAELQVAILQYLRDTGQLRLDPATGILGRSMDRQQHR